MEKWITKNKKKIISGRKDFDKFLLIERIKKELEKEIEIKDLKFNQKEREFIKQFNFLTNEKVIYLANINEDKLLNYQKNSLFKKYNDYINKNNLNSIVISVKIEDEIAKINSKQEKEQFLNEYKLKEKGINLILKEVFKLLDLRIFFTCGKNEIHLWKFKLEIKVPEAAGIIHTDFKKGFIKAEIFSYQQIIKYKLEEILKEKGLIKIRRERL